MKPSLRLILLLGLACCRTALAEDAEAGLAAVRQLGTVNGQALACAEKDVAAQARLLMLAHAPKTQRFGTAYEEATQTAYLAQTKGNAACPEGKALAAQLGEIADRLKAALPGAPVPATK